MDDLNLRFSSLGPIEKTKFLARVVHGATIAARESYCPSADHPERNFDHPDAVMLRDANNFVHRVAGYIMHVLDRTAMVGQDESIMAMIEHYYRERESRGLLLEWLANSNEDTPHP